VRAVSERRRDGERRCDQHTCERDQHALHALPPSLPCSPSRGERGQILKSGAKSAD
jgi:hypothetical protein